MNAWHRFAAVGFALVVLMTARGADALPMFARKYNQPCSNCHDPAFPRLNDVGYKFRRAGFRMPEQIGQEELSDFDVGNYLSGRVQARYTLAHTSDETVSPSTSETVSTFSMPEITLYPITGSFLKYFATEIELSFGPDELPEIENAYLRGVLGKEDLWFEARAGIWHPFEGFGGSDRPRGVSRPLLETQGANQNQDTLFRIWGIDQVGIEAGIQWKNTSLSAALVNGLQTEVEDGEVVGVGITPDQGIRKDVVVIANQILGERTGISAYFAHGSVQLPFDEAAFIADTDTRTFRDDYNRVALFGSLGVGIVTALAGGELGWDDSRDPATGAMSTFRSQGAFVEGDFAIRNFAVPFLRLDYFDPSAAKDDNEMLGATLGASIFYEYVALIPELSYRTSAGAVGDRVDTSGLINAVVIY